MTFPPFLILRDEAQYRAHFQAHFCGQAHATHDHIRVLFDGRNFNHAFYESTDRRNPTKDQFALERAKRMPWIAETLVNPEARLLAGWDSEHSVYRHDRRVALLQDTYTVIIRLGKVGIAHFVTAYPLSPSTTSKILASPAWDPRLSRWRRWP